MTKIRNPLALANICADLICAPFAENRQPRYRLAAETILKESDNGVTACAAVLATMGALFDRGGAMVLSAEKRETFYTHVLNVITENDGIRVRRHKDWIKVFYWLRDGGDSESDDLSYYAAITLWGCKSKPVSGMEAAGQLCTALRGRELVYAGEQYGDGNNPDAGFKAVFNRLSMLINAMIGKPALPLPALKPFTVWISDQVFTENHYTETPFICHVVAATPEDIYSAAMKCYRASFGLPHEGWQGFAEQNGAYIWQVIHGHIPFNTIAVDFDGYHAVDLENVFNAEIVK